MTNWLRALAPLALTAIAVVVFFTADRTVGMLLIVAALASTFLSGKSVFGRPSTRPERDVGPAEVRAYREAHPGSTISDAVSAVGGTARR
jgi:hypothetical protein